jgi:hypothetical protein
MDRISSVSAQTGTPEKFFGAVAKIPNRAFAKPARPLDTRFGRFSRRRSSNSVLAFEQFAASARQRPQLQREHDCNGKERENGKESRNSASQNRI